eukprot:TRINITY_DN3619_c0_g1_i1.p1 TRINITY_DN3619_c0_g1~~TRINITY_DN3619_c0_g1_i1.p1  ORF type:complete len:346 (+),score=101.08 TRINITY_DN3619_c0_g1_i1:66-1103(+)
MISRKSRTYADVCLKQGASYFNYESVELQFGQQSDYEITGRLGRGKYAEVFEGIKLSTGQTVVIKILKPIKKKKVKRELKILQTLTGTPNVTGLVDLVRDSETGMISFILEYAPNVEYRLAHQKMVDLDARIYMYELLRTLDSVHSKGIMHRDIKPLNIMYDPEKKEIKLVDWGLAEFYLPNTAYNVKVASRYYKAPELLVDYTFYDYAIDIWGAGAVLAGIVFMREPFFQGNDNVDQLEKITRILGTDDFMSYLKKYKIELDTRFEGVLAHQPKRPWTKLVTPYNQHLANPAALDLIDKMLVYDHGERITAKEALSHPYFEPVLEYYKTAKKDTKATEAKKASK